MSKRHSLVLAVSAAALFLAIPGSALADVGLVAPHALSPTKQTQSKPGQVSPNAAVAAVGDFTCNNSWDPIANVPGGYAIGECQGTKHLHRTVKDTVTDPSTGASVTYDGGFFTQPDFSGCGWIANSQDTQANSTSYTDCNPASTSESSFAFVMNCMPTQCHSGDNLTVTHTCWEYANVQPWLSTPVPQNFIRQRDPGATLLWRYITRHPDANGNYWVMVLDPNYSAGQGNWVFVPTGCFDTPFPSVAGHTLYYP